MIVRFVKQYLISKVKHLNMSAIKFKHENVTDEMSEVIWPIVKRYETRNVMCTDMWKIDATSSIYPINPLKVEGLLTYKTLLISPYCIAIHIT